MTPALIQYIIQTARKSTMPLSTMQNKLGEEYGELSEAVLHHEGFSAHKTMKEPLAGEVADVINTAIGVLVKAYPDLNDGQIAMLLIDQLMKKTDKWVAVQSNIQVQSKESSHE